MRSLFEWQAPAPKAERQTGCAFAIVGVIGAMTAPLGFVRYFLSQNVARKSIINGC